MSGGRFYNCANCVWIVSRIGELSQQGLQAGVLQMQKVYGVCRTMFQRWLNFELELQALCSSW